MTGGQRAHDNLNKYLMGERGLGRVMKPRARIAIECVRRIVY
jgi:hypothetical protein